MITEISDAVGESGRGCGRITASEVFGAEILVASTIPQHVVDGCQDRRGNRDRCLLGAVARFETEELGLEIAVGDRMAARGARAQQPDRIAASIMVPRRSAAAP